MAEGDTILRAARRIDAALAGAEVSAGAPNPRGRLAGIRQLDGMVMVGARSHGKHLLLDFGELVLHSHLGVNGSWHVYERGASWRKPSRSAWAVLRSERAEAVQFGGPTLRVLQADQVRRDPTLARLGPDILAPGFTVEAGVESLRRAHPSRQVGDVLLDQELLAGIGNIFKSEGCFAARLDPWRRLRGADDAELGAAVGAIHELMDTAVRDGRHPRRVYRRAGEPCPECRTPIRSHGQGDANRTTYWCPRCQASPEQTAPEIGIHGGPGSQAPPGRE
jgi:endonuclease-8